MATVTQPTKPEPVEVIQRWRFSVKDYHRMGEAGIFPPEARVELIEGEIIAMSPIGFRHRSRVARLDALMNGTLGARANVFIQSSIQLDDYSEPEPDVVVARPRPDFYLDLPVTPPDVLLLIEVMETSADYDRRVKLALYARAGVAEVWLVDLKKDRVETYRRPVGGSYQDMMSLGRGQSLAPEALADLILTVDSILG
jgi:Uma2 family endonuclease